MSHPVRTFFLMLIALVFLSGCTTAQYFQLVLNVKNKADGTPLAEVSITIDTVGNEERKFDPEYGSRRNSTGQGGGLTQDFMVSPYPNDSKHWYLKLTKEGFETVVVDIKPHPQPKGQDGKIPLPVEVLMQPKGQATR